MEVRNLPYPFLRGQPLKCCDAANGRLGRELFCMLRSDISMNFRESAICNLHGIVDMSTMDLIFLPMHLDGNHRGLLAFGACDCFMG